MKLKEVIKREKKEMLKKDIKTIRIGYKKEKVMYSNTKYLPKN